MNRLGAILGLLFCMAASTAVAQQIDPPQDQDRYYMSVFTHDNWQSIPEESRLIQMLDQGSMARLKAGCAFKHYTQTEPVYATGRFWNIRESEFPVLLISDRDGAYFYKISKGNIPGSADQIFEDAKQAFYKDKALHENALPKPTITYDPVIVPEPINYEPEPGNYDPIERDPILPNAPWNKPVQVDHDISGIFGPGTPVRDSLGSVAWIFGSIVALFFLSVLFFGFLMVLALVLYVLKR